MQVPSSRERGTACCIPVCFQINFRLFSQCSDTRHENMEVESAGNESDCPSVSQPESQSESQPESQSASQPERSNEKLVQELQTLRKNYMISTGLWKSCPTFHQLQSCLSLRKCNLVFDSMSLTGTVSSLRRDLSFREADLLKAGSDQDRLQRELTERVAQLHAMSSKVPAKKLPNSACLSGHCLGITVQIWCWAEVITHIRKKRINYWIQTICKYLHVSSINTALFAL